MSGFTPVENASSFRRMAAAMWRSPSDPSIYGSMDVDATAPLAFLTEHQRTSGVRLTVTHLVARAVALALRDQPEINGKVRFWGRLEQRATVDVFVTVATEGNKDLSGARIERADEKSLAALATEIAGRVGAIRSGTDASYTQSRRAIKQLHAESPRHQAAAVVAGSPGNLALRCPGQRAARRSLVAGHALRSVRLGDRHQRRHVRHRLRVRAVRAARALPDVDPRSRGAATSLGCR